MSVSKHIAFYNEMIRNNYGKVTVGTTTGLDYMDAFHCEKIDSTDFELVCSAYQPDWYLEEEETY